MSLCKSFGLLLTCLVLASCAANTVSPSQLKDPVVVDAFVLQEVVSYKGNAAAMGRASLQGLTPGLYVAFKADDGGTYYKGEGTPVWVQTVGQSGAALMPGGVYLPRDGAKPPLMFAVYTATLYQTEDLQAFLAKSVAATSAKGNIDAYLQQRATPPNARPSTADVVGGAVGGAIVDLLIAADEGKHYVFPAAGDSAFVERLRSAVANRKPVQSR